MFIKKFDYLSPTVTLHYNGSLSHSSLLSGIFSIISIAIIIAFAVFFFLDMIKRKDPKAFYYNSFVEDAGTFNFSSSSLFHFISLATINSHHINDGFDFTFFRIVGFDNYFAQYLADKNLSRLDHWIYGICSYENDASGISDIINKDFFEKSACIKKYFNSAEQKYYDTNDPKFKWPIISHGTFNQNYSLYNFVIEKCQEETLNLIMGENYHCKSNQEIELFVNNLVVFYFYFINNYIDILNYKNPITKYLFNIEHIFSNNQYTQNHLNFNPSNIKSHNGLIFDTVQENNYYIYDKNDIFKEDSEESGIYSVIIFWLKNTMNYYERSYKKFQDVISSIGGINQFITIVAAFINSLYNNYVVLCDTSNLLFFSINSEKNNIKINEKKKSNYKK